MTPVKRITNSPIFGGFGQQTIVVGTTHVKYNSVTSSEQVVEKQSGASKIVKITLHNITCMKEYENKSPEELRLEDYAAYRKGVPAGVLRGSNPFGAPWPGFGTASSGFGATKPDFGTSPSSVAPWPSYSATWPKHGEFSFGAKPSTDFQFKPIVGGLNGGLFGDTCRKGAPLVTLGATNSSAPRLRPPGLPSNKTNSDLSMENKNGNNLLNIAPKTSTLSEFVTFLNDFKFGKDYKMSPVYQCHDCGLSFDRLDYIAKHSDNCSPDRRIVKTHCICGLVFDKQNYDYHCEVHRKFTLLKVKEIAVRDKVTIDVSGMTAEFAEDNESELQRKEAANPSQALVESSVEENDIEKNKTKEKTADCQTLRKRVSDEDGEEDKQ